MTRLLIVEDQSQFGQKQLPVRQHWRVAFADRPASSDKWQTPFYITLSFENSTISLRFFYLATCEGRKIKSTVKYDNFICKLRKFWEE